jgi:hypothetical protein
VSNVLGEAVFIDRRVDPNQRITLKIDAASIDNVLASVAELQSLGASHLGPLRYFGPRPAAEQLRTIAAVRADEVARLPAAQRSTFQRKQHLAWPRLTEPRRLVTSLIQQRGWRIDHAERIPHDLWPAGKLPDLTLTQQLTVLLIGFDLSFEIRAHQRSFEIVPLERMAIRRRYPLTDGFPDPRTILQQELPATSARMEGNSMVVDARVEDHERLVELLGGRTGRTRRERAPRGSTQVFTLRVQEQPVGAVIRQLAERLSWSIEFDEAAIREAGRSLDTRVSFAVENSKEEELLEAVLKPAGLDFHRDGERLRIVPRE